MSPPGDEQVVCAHEGAVSVNVSVSAPGDEQVVCAHEGAVAVVLRGGFAGRHLGRVDETAPVNVSVIVSVSVGVSVGVNFSVSATV